jgi:hypothetical protein
MALLRKFPIQRSVGDCFTAHTEGAVMAFLLHPHVILIAYWLIMIVLAAFFLRLACSLCRAGIPSWRRSFVSVFVVTLLGYLAFDFTCYLIMRSMDGVLIRVPFWYSYSLWFREPFGLKWYIVSHAGPFRFVPFLLGLFVAGLVQFIVLEADVSYGFGLLIVVLQWIATVVAGYIVSLLFGVVLSVIGATLQGEPEKFAPEQVLDVPHLNSRTPGKMQGRPQR